MRGQLYAYLIEEWAAIIQSRLQAHQVGKYGRRMGERVAVLDHRRGLVCLTLAVGCAPGGLDNVCILQLLKMF